MEIKDQFILDLVAKEENRQLDGIELIASENFVSPQVLATQGSVLTNKYAEGYPGKRYYGGCEYVDQVEQAAIDRAKELFGADYVNVQPHSGSSANLAVYRALLEDGDRVLGLDLNEGGHLTHGSPVNFSGKWYDMYAYGTDPESNRLDYEEIERIAHEVQPKMIIAGATAYSRQIDFERIGKIAKDVGAYYMVDMAHIAGLVATGLHPNPVPYADVVTTTTHKTLRGPRGGMILAEEEHAKALRKEIFPGLQGGPLMHVIAAKAVALYEASQPQFKSYIEQVIKNAQAMAQVFMDHGVDVITGGTDNHLFLVDLTNLGITGKDAQEKLDRAGITTNKNTVPGETLSPSVTSGLRIGSAAITTRGLKEAEAQAVAELMLEVLKADEDQVPALREKAHELVKDYPLFQWFD